MHVQHTGDWYIQTIGRYTMSAVPVESGHADSRQTPRSIRRSGIFQH